MKENEISFYTQFSQLTYTFFEVTKKFSIVTCKVPVTIRTFLKWVMYRFINWSVIASSRSYTSKCADLGIKFYNIAFCRKSPFTLYIRHKAYFVQTITIIEPRHYHPFLSALKLRTQFHFGKRVTRTRASEH